MIPVFWLKNKIFKWVAKVVHSRQKAIGQAIKFPPARKDLTVWQDKAKWHPLCDPTISELKITHYAKR
jgi:hypothetical protein